MKLINFLNVFQGKAEGEKSKIWFRAYFQKELSQLGRFEHKHAGKVIFVAIVALTVFFVGIKSSQIHHKVEQLWIPRKCSRIAF